MGENYLDTIEIDGIDEAMEANLDVDEIELANTTVIDFIIDGSASMGDYEAKGTMHDCLEHYKNAICNSKQSDEMLVSKTIFHSTVENGGYVKPEDFDTDYHTRGCTKLYDAIVARRKLLVDYMDQIKDNGGTPRGVMVILSDGWDNASKFSISDARMAIADLKKKEIVVAFIAFGDEAKGIANDLGIDSRNVMEVSNDESSLRHVIDLVSKSAISASKRASAGLSAADAGFFDV